MSFFEIKFGPRQEPTVAGLFGKIVRFVLYTASLLWFVMQLPWICYLLTPLAQDFATEPRYAKNIMLLMPLGVECAPVWLACILLALPIGFAGMQNDFLSLYAKEHSLPLSWSQKLLLWLPLGRYWALYRFFARQNAGWSLVMIFAALLFWLFAIIAGPLNPFPPIALALSIGIWLALARKLAGCGSKRSNLIWGKSLLVLFLLSILAGYAAFYLTRAEINAEKLAWRSAGIPTSRTELEKHIFQGIAPNPDFCKLVGCYQKPSYDSGMDLLTSPSGSFFGYYGYPASKRKQLKEYLAGEKSKLDFNKLDELAASGSLLKYKIEFDPILTNTLLPHSNFYRTAMRYFSSRIVVSLEEGDCTKAMRLFRLMTAFQESVLQSDFSIGSLVAIACEHIRIDTVGALLGSGLISDADLRELAQLNRNRAEKIHSALRHGLRADAFMTVDTIRDQTVPYPKFLLQMRIETDYGNPDDKQFMHFLFRGNTTLFPTPPCLWTEAIQQRYLLHAMRRQRARIRYFDDPADNYLREVRREALERELDTQTWYLEKLFFQWDPQSFDSSFSRTLSMLRMSDLALKIEQFRRTNGRLPNDLAELGTLVPIDALSGEPIRYAAGKIRLWEYDSKTGYQSRELPGWQLSASGGNWLPPEKKTWKRRVGKGSITRLTDTSEPHEAERDTFTVITQWPVPPTPEPPAEPEADKTPYPWEEKKP